MLTILVLYFLKIIIIIILFVVKLHQDGSLSIILYYLFYSLLISLCILLSVAFLTYLERKRLAAIQSRKGPNKIGYFGILQPIADGIKLFLKETIIPRNSAVVVFFLASVYAFFIGLSFWVILPFSYTFIQSNLSYGILFVFILSIMHVYSVILAGWSSNSHYSMLGALRSSAQLIGYDITMVLILLNIALDVKSLDINEIIENQIVGGYMFLRHPFLFVIFYICCVAETNRHPFDLPEAEAELVSGYNVEYSGMSFSLFFLGEYASLIFMSTFLVNIFLGGWHFFYFTNSIILAIFYVLKIGFIIWTFIFARGIMPRYRYDQLMRIGWKYLLPVVFTWLLFTICCVYFFPNGLIEEIIKLIIK